MEFTLWSLFIFYILLLFTWDYCDGHDANVKLIWLFELVVLYFNTKSSGDGRTAKQELLNAVRKVVRLPDETVSEGGKHTDRLFLCTFLPLLQVQLADNSTLCTHAPQAPAEHHSLLYSTSSACAPQTRSLNPYPGRGSHFQPMYCLVVTRMRRSTMKKP